MSAVLIASDSAVDVDVVCRLLTQEGFASEKCVDPKRLGADFERVRPQVLVLAFKTLEAAERHYLGLYRQSQVVAGLPHRTLLLCQMDSTREAYDRCRAGVFDDYVQFWPFNHDGMSLPKAVHLALRSGEGQQAAAAMTKIAAQARRIAELEAMLDTQLLAGRLHAGALAEASAHAKAEIGAALDGLGRRILEDGLDDAVVVRDAARVHDALERVDRHMVQPALGRVQQAIGPVQHWMGELKEELAAPLAAARAMNQQVQSLRPMVLLVDDDRFVVRALQSVLADVGCDTQVAGDAAEAMQALRQRTPDLILMDVGLPDITGIELVRRFKHHSSLSDVPVLMLTGQSDKATIVDSMAAGARDFIVKPFERELLTRKVSRLLMRE